jgi:NAD(P)-dependent dehydrogenase (short-subunit alcohol dehydrogenase family)/acyl carrier protein
VTLPSYPFRHQRYWLADSRVPEPAADSWRYRVTWKPVTGEATLAGSGNWLLVVPESLRHHRLASACADALAGAGVQVAVLPADTATVTEAWFAAHLPAGIDGLLSLLALDEQPHPSYRAVPRGLSATLALVRALSGASQPVPLWMATQGSVAATPADRLDNPVQAAIWGFGRTVALEHPGLWGGLIDLPATIDRRFARHLTRALAGRGAEDQLAIRPSGMFGRRLVRAAAPAVRGDSPFRPRGTVLVTGGTAGFGSHVARWLAAQGSEHLVLTGDGGADLAAELDTKVTIVDCDLTDRDALAALLAEHPPTAVFHTAGAMQTAELAATDLAALDGVLSEKVLGAANLHELLDDRELDAFVLFSSVAGTWGSGGQAGYAAASAYLDALAVHRGDTGRPAMAVAWGLWDEVGLGEAAEDEARREQLRRRGLTAMDPDLALAALREALDSGETAIVIAAMNWDRFAPAFTAQRPRPLIADLPEVRQALTAGGAAPGGAMPELRRRLAGLTPEEQAGLLARAVRAEVAEVLGHPGPEAVPPGRAFRDLGFDSLAAVGLRNRLATVTGLKLPATLVFDHASPEALAEFLRSRLAAEAGTPTAVTLDGGLDSVAAALAMLPEDDPRRGEAATRLRALLGRLDGKPSGTRAIADRMRAASDDELFDFLDSELER